jgi:hypothetical protein
MQGIGTQDLNIDELRERLRKMTDLELATSTG